MSTITSDTLHPFLQQNGYIRWSELKPSAIVADIRKAIADASARVDAIASLAPADVTFENTFLALDEATEELNRAWTLVQHLDSVLNNGDLRTAHSTVLPEVSAFYSQIPLNARLWQVLKAAAAKCEQDDLPPACRRLISETVEGFLDSGADLSPDNKVRVEAINRELAEATQKFSENVLDSTNAWEIYLSEAEADGLPESAIAAARESAKAAAAKGKPQPEGKPLRFTLHAPSLMPAMRYLNSDDLRWKFWEASCAVAVTGEWDNTGLVSKILKLRHEKAKILGTNHFADWVLRRRMAKSGAKALQFVTDLHGRIEAAFHDECRQLEEFASRKTGRPVDRLQPWQVGYYAELFRREAYDLDEELLRPYFPIGRVQDGMFRITEQLFGITIRPRKTVFRSDESSPIPSDAAEVWHPDVKCYDVLDGDVLLGLFYTDWHPRETKRSGAWMNALVTGCPAGIASAERIPHVGVICGNLTPPVGDKPALLTHDEVITIFHEFGHLLHHLLGEVPVRSLNGINVAWDFVELPSQILENWCWDRQSLDLFARHYETGEPIPQDLFDKMIRARNFLSACDFMRQLSFAKLDLELHLHADKITPENIDQFLDKILAGYTIPLKTKQPPIIRRFTHLFASSTGYAAGYYSYKWAEVLDADAFTRFQSEGILNQETGRTFRREILAKGNSQPPEDLFHAFMGRSPNPNALLIRSGIPVQS